MLASASSWRDSDVESFVEPGDADLLEFLATDAFPYDTLPVRGGGPLDASDGSSSAWVN